ncbi:hypothetical protein ABEB36_010150 [Hypothenemus hampei]|uniref:Transcription factor CBF/NF-Y/archaeal histone domain-containing protein n=1 Tax=Hypothenemus hampei TaxID=57062 RepID=A0ABD1EKS7_HYPHA
MDKSSNLFQEVETETDNEVEIDIQNLSNGLHETESSSETSDPKKTSPETLNKPAKYVRLPQARIKQIMKLDPDVVMIQQEAILLVTKATELFIEFLTKESIKHLAGNKRKTIMRRDVDLAVESASQLCFLDGALE